MYIKTKEFYKQVNAGGSLRLTDTFIWLYAFKKQSLYSPGQVQRVPGGLGSQFQDNLHMKVVRFSAPRTGSLYRPGYISGTHFCQRLSQPQGHSAAGRMSKNSNDTIGNRTRDLPACSAVPQPTAPPRVPRKNPLYPLNRKLGGPQSRSRRF